MSQPEQEKKPGGLFHFFHKFFKNPVSSVEETVTSVGEMTGKAMGTAGELIGSGFVFLGKSFINTGKFLTNTEYREKEVYPWLQSVLRDNWRKVNQELTESQDMLLILWKYSRGYELTDDEKKAATEQLFDLMKVVPALAIFALPGGAVLLPLVARALPWDLMPSSFKEKVKEEFGEDSLKQELDKDEHIPVDEDVEIPEEVQEQAVENFQELVEKAGEGTAKAEETTEKDEDRS